MLVKREITSYVNTLDNLKDNLLTKMRGLTAANSEDPNNEPIWDSTKGWVVFKDLDGDLQLLAGQKYFDVTADAWVKRSNVFACYEWKFILGLYF